MRTAEMKDEIERLNAALGSPLTQSAFNAAAKIGRLLKKHGPRPDLSREVGEETGAYVLRIIRATRPWDDLIAADWQEIKRDVLQARSDLAKMGLQDDEFDGNLPAESPSEEQLKMFIEKLRSLGVKAFDF